MAGNVLVQCSVAPKLYQTSNRCTYLSRYLEPSEFLVLHFESLF
jgi:hypothetical protein